MDGSCSNRSNEQVRVKVKDRVLAAALELDPQEIAFFPLGMVPHHSGQLFFLFIGDRDGIAHWKIILNNDAHPMPRNILHVAELLQPGGPFLRKRPVLTVETSYSEK